MSKTKPETMPAGYFGWSLLNGEQGANILKGVLHNLSSAENGDQHEYSKGLLVGVVSTLVACGMTIQDAEQLVWQCLPTDCHYERFPESFRTSFMSRIAKETIPLAIDPIHPEDYHHHMDRRQADMGHKETFE